MKASAFLWLFIPIVLAACSWGDLTQPATNIQPKENLSVPTAVNITPVIPSQVIEPENTKTPDIGMTGVGQVSVTPTRPRISLTPSKTSTPTKKPTRTKVPTNTRVPTKTATATRIPPTPVPQDAPVRIYNPASYSKIGSVFQLVAAVVPGANGNVHMQLTGENARKILEKTWIFSYANGRRTTINEEFTVEIPGVAEDARLTIFTLDNYGRIVALSSEDILLISIGKDDIMEAQNLMEPFTLRIPYPDSQIRHGIVEVRGITRARTASAVFYELVDQKGKVVGSYAAPEVLQPSLEYQPVSIDIPYVVDRATPVRLIMHQVDVRNGMDVAVSSVLIKLYP